MKDSGPSVTRRKWLKAAGLIGLTALTPRLEECVAGDTAESTLTFRQLLDKAPWPPRYGHGVTVFQDRIWVLGGTATLHDGDQWNDVWFSEDGVTWHLALASAPWAPRWCHGAFAFADRLWVIGGLASVDPIRNLNDIWSSPDGKSWTREVADAPWTARHVWATVMHRNRLYLLGGATDGSHFYRDVLSSCDGIHWRSEVPQEPWFSNRKNHSAASFGGRIILAGGSVLDASQPGGGRLLNDVWSSEDGGAWTCLTDKAPWTPRNFHVLTSYRDKLWLLGGELGAGHYATDLWSSTNGTDWKLETDRSPWPGRHAGGLVIFQDKIWVLGGTSSSWGTSSRNDIWTVEESGAGPGR